MQSGARPMGESLLQSTVALFRKNQRYRTFPVFKYLEISRGLCLVVGVFLYTWETVGKIPDRKSVV